MGKISGTLQMACRWSYMDSPSLLGATFTFYVLMQAYSECMGFVTIVNGAVRGRSMKEDVPCSPVSVCGPVLYVGVACIAIV